MSEDGRDERSGGMKRFLVGSGVHWWCRCGKTGYPPFCDGSHRGTGIQPERMEVEGEVEREWEAGEGREV